MSYDVVLAGAVHHSFDDLPFVDPTYEEGELPIDRAHRITADLTLAFLHRHLRGREDTVHKVAGRYQEASVHPFRHGSGGDEVRSREKEGGTLGGNRGSTRAHPGIPRTRALADSLGTDSFLLLMGGEERARFGDVTREYRLHSIRKSLLGTLFGVALARGDADTARTLADLRMDDDPSLSPAEKTATVRHLLQSRSGIFLPATHENPAWDRVRPRRGSHPPGAYWHYSNWGFNAAGAAYQIMTGESLFRAFERDIARPIGMTDFSREDGAWRYGVRSRHPAYVFRMSTRDLARFGQLMLQGGWWNGQAVVPEAWVHEITRPHSRASLPDGTPMEDTGYGMTWWVPLAEERHGVAIGQGAFVASGTGTQLLLVAPALELVFVHRNDTDGPSEEYRSIPASDAYRLLSILLSELTGAEQLREPRRAPGERLFR